MGMRVECVEEGQRMVDDWMGGEVEKVRDGVGKEGTTLWRSQSRW
jgi:hypothetical protein